MQREGPAPEGKQGSQFSRGRWQEGTADQMTRRFDVLIAALLLMLTLPLMLFVALAIKWESELCAKVGDGLTGRRRRIVGVFEPPLLQQRSDTPCGMLTSSSCFN